MREGAAQSRPENHCVLASLVHVQGAPATIDWHRGGTDGRTLLQRRTRKASNTCLHFWTEGDVDAQQGKDASITGTCRSRLFAWFGLVFQAFTLLGSPARTVQAISLLPACVAWRAWRACRSTSFKPQMDRSVFRDGHCVVLLALGRVACDRFNSVLVPETGAES